MTKAELIEMVHETSDVPKVVVERVLDGLRGVMLAGAKRRRNG